VSWMFKRRGYFAIERGAMDEEKFMELALDLGADDVSIEEDHYDIYATLEDFAAVQEELDRRGVPVAVKELAMMPQTYAPLPADRVAQVLRLVEALEDHDDVQNVWMNLDPNAIDDKVAAAHS
jgi:transcriptional/translational regulatory protein YebC/TACO1